MNKLSDVILKGIDVSEHNGVIYWDKVKNSGQVDFVMIRAGYGQNAIDRKFVYNASECNRLGIPIGIYWFSYAANVNAVINEANKCIETIKDYKITYPVAFDWEDDSVRVCQASGVNPTKDLATTMAKTFLDIMDSNGYLPCLYTNPAYLNQYFDYESIKKYLDDQVDLWLAQWPYGTPDLTKRPSQNPTIWQYSEKGRIDGISTAVDINVSYFDYANTKEDYSMADLSMDNLRTALRFENQKLWFEKKDNGESPKDTAEALGFTDGSRPYDIPSRAEVMTMISRSMNSMKVDINMIDKKLDNMIDRLNNLSSDDRK